MSVDLMTSLFNEMMINIKELNTIRDNSPRSDRERLTNMIGLLIRTLNDFVIEYLELIHQESKEVK